MNKNRQDIKHWDRFWEENKGKKTLFNALVAIVRKYYFAKIFAEFIARNYDIAGKEICEIGSGTGLTLAYLKKMGAGRCVGVDYSEVAVKMAVETQKECEFIQADAFKLDSIGDKSFDLVYSLGFLEHYTKEEQFQALSEQKRIARECVFIEVPYNIFYLRWLLGFNRMMGRTFTYSDEELFTEKTFRELGLKGATKLMPTAFFLTIGHFEQIA